MKIRAGFVSNSSSSSYVICVAKVIDEEKLKAFLEDKGLDGDIYTTEEALNGTGWRRPTTTYGDKTYFKCESFDCNEVTLEMDKDADEKFVSMGCYSDIEENEDGYVEPDEIYDGGIYDLSEEHGVTDIQITEGCGRNG